MHYGALFPEESKKILYVGAQLGVGLYMFIVGLTFDKDEFRAGAKSAAAVAFGSMAAPFAVAALMAPWLMGIDGLFTPRVGTAQAVPVLEPLLADESLSDMARFAPDVGTPPQGFKIEEPRRRAAPGS